MPVLLVFNFGEVFTLESVSNNDFGFSFALSEFFQCSNDFCVVVSINDNCFPSKSFKFTSNRLNIISMHGCLRLAKSIDVDDSNQIIELVISTEVYSLPNTAFSDLAVSANTEYCVVNLVKIFT